MKIKKKKNQKHVIVIAWFKQFSDLKHKCFTTGQIIDFNQSPCKAAKVKSAARHRNISNSFPVLRISTTWAFQNNSPFGFL